MFLISKFKYQRYIWPHHTNSYQNFMDLYERLKLLKQFY